MGGFGRRRPKIETGWLAAAKTPTHQLTMQANYPVYFDTTSYCTCNGGTCGCAHARSGYMAFVESALSLANQEVDTRLSNNEQVGMGEAIRVVGRRWRAMRANDKDLWDQLAALG
jgi:hypothetical protein